MSAKRGPALTWDDLATFYDAANGGRRARTLAMDVVWDWASKQPRFAVGRDGAIREITTQERKR